MVLILVLLAMACSSKMDPEKLLLRVMEKEFSEGSYTVTSKDGNIYFDDTEEMAGHGGSYKMVNDFLIITIMSTTPDMSNSWQTGVYKYINDEWVSLLTEDLVFGDFVDMGVHTLIQVTETLYWPSKDDGEYKSEQFIKKYIWDPPTLSEFEETSDSWSLVIHGKDIWVRDEPATGEVVMKLNEGDRCEIISRGYQEIIRGMNDYWYEIEFKGNTGWVFGAQTSIISEEEPLEFATLEEVKEKYVFDSDELPEGEEWEGDRVVVMHTGTHHENEFAIVSFDEPGMMGGYNFSVICFREDDHWKGYKFPGAAIKIMHKNDQMVALMFVETTGGAFTIDNDYLLFTIDPEGKSFRHHQFIFDFAKDFDGREVYGSATVSFPQENNNLIEISEEIDHYHDEGRKGTFVTTYRFDDESMTYKLIEE